MRSFTTILIAVVLIFSLETGAQSPTPAPEPSGDVLRRAMAELKADLESTRAETKTLVIQKERERNARLERAIARERQRQAYLATLAVERQEAQIKIEKLAIQSAEAKTVEALQQRNAVLENKIKKANRTWACRVLHIGCVRVKVAK